MSSFLSRLNRVILWLCAALALVIAAALSVQIFSRYVLGAPVHMTDDIAEVSLIWLTFLGAAAVYRERGHIAVSVVEALPNPALKKIIRILNHVLVIGVLGLVLNQVAQVQPLMGRLDFGTLPRSPWTSKFALVLVPFALGAGLTLVFALEAIWAEIREGHVE